MHASRDPESWYWYGNEFSAANDSYATTTMLSNAQEMSELNHACGRMSSSNLLGIRWKTRYYFVFKTFNRQKKQGKSLSQTKELECENDPADMVELKLFITLSMSSHRTLVGFGFEPLRMKAVETRTQQTSWSCQFSVTLNLISKESLYWYWSCCKNLTVTLTHYIWNIETCSFPLIQKWLHFWK